MNPYEMFKSIMEFEAKATQFDKELRELISKYGIDNDPNSDKMKQIALTLFMTSVMKYQSQTLETFVHGELKKVNPDEADNLVRQLNVMVMKMSKEKIDHFNTLKKEGKI